MKGKIPDIIRKWPVFVYLLPVFFVLHTYTENYGLITLNELLLLAGIYLAAAFLLSGAFKVLYRNYTKANLLAFSILLVYFFYGSSIDFLKSVLPGSFITRYSFIIPVIVVLLLLLGFILKRSKKEYSKVRIYLNTLLLLLIIIDGVSLVTKISKQGKTPYVAPNEPLTICDTCKKPDIYLIVVDEYAGYTELQDIFSFKNDSFENQLGKRGFHVIKDSRSNYNRTVYSMASCLNMGYIYSLTKPKENRLDNYYCTDLIRKNRLTPFLEQNGYGIFNYSFFDLGNRKRINDPNIVPSGKALITEQTFHRRFLKEVGHRLVSKSYIEDILKHHLYCNLKTDSLTKKVLNDSASPKFVYTHLMLPHPPYFFDSKGKAADYNTLLNENAFKSEKKAYLEYLVYSNNYLLDLVDRIQSSSVTPPVIILMSDHGFRQFEDEKEVDQRYYFMTLNAVSMPGYSYDGFYDGMSNVNQFRVVLNTVFGQKLAMIKDSVTYIWNH